MKKIVLVVLALSASFLFTSCGEFWENMFGRITGNAVATIDGRTTELSSSIAMMDKKATPKYVVGLATVMDIDDLIKIDSEDDIEYPVLCYRLTGNNIKSGAMLTASNVLTEEDLRDFDYTSLINGSFSDNQVVGIAVSESKFYVMSSGSIRIDKVRPAKITGYYSGSAYVIDLNADPMISEEQVIISGTFVSRFVPIKPWISRLQKKN